MEIGHEHQARGTRMLGTPGEERAVVHTNQRRTSGRPSACLFVIPGMTAYWHAASVHAAACGPLRGCGAL